MAEKTFTIKQIIAKPIKFKYSMAFIGFFFLGYAASKLNDMGGNILGFFAGIASHYACKYVVYGQVNDILSQLKAE